MPEMDREHFAFHLRPKSEYREAEIIVKEWYGPNNIEAVQVSSMIALVLIQENKLAEAEPLLQHLLESRVRHVGRAAEGGGVSIACRRRWPAQFR